VPYLLLVRHFAPQEAAGTSLAVVFVNAVSGTIAYARQRRIDYASGVWFAAAALPGAVLGAFGVRLLSRSFFHLVFGILLMLAAAILFWKPAGAISEAATPARRGWRPILPITRRVVDARGEAFEYRYDRFVGLALSFVVGFVSSMLGVGGGIIHVPALVFLLSFPPHISTATSHFILAITAGAGAASHLALGHVRIVPALLLGAGAAAGAPLGARLSRGLHGQWILRGLALALLLVGIRLLAS
jgi:uncharacterized membrane protein YfcA